MKTPKDKKPQAVTPRRQNSNPAIREKNSHGRPDGVFDLNEDISRVRRRLGDIDGKKPTGEKISFDTADKLAEEIASIRTRKKWQNN